MATLLVIDDEPAICWGLAELGKRLRHEVLTAPSAECGLALARQRRLDLILLDVRLPGMNGLSALPLFKELAPAAPVTVMTAHGDLSTAVEAVRLGAFDYVAKPFDLCQIEQVIERSLATPSPAAAVAPIDVSTDGLIGRTSSMQEVFKRIALVAPSSACVMLSGESGTGKELVARAIHRYSRHSAGPFIAVNVAALSPTLAESELFGHVRGAFTGADGARAGLLADADGGTLFLDEVADIPLPLQVKLLRALDHGEILPVGTSHCVQANFRLITASHQNLLEKVQAGEFRHDLYYRLATFPIELPPLSRRREDIPVLANHFVERLSCQSDPPVKLSHQAAEELARRAWRGNVRELRNAIEHALVLAREGVILPEHLPPPVPDLQESRGRANFAPEPLAQDATQDAAQLALLLGDWTRQQLASNTAQANFFEAFLQFVEPPFLAAVLNRHGGQCSAAARTLGIHRTTLKKKLDQYGIAGDE